MNLRSMRISLRAALCFSLITLVVIILGLFSFLQLRDLRAKEQDIELNWMLSMQIADDIQISLLHARLESIRLLTVNDDEDKQASIRELKKYRDIMKERTAYYHDNLVSSDKEQAHFDEAASLMVHYLDGIEHIINLSASSRDQALDFANGEQKQRALVYQEKLTGLRTLNAQGAKGAGISASQTYEQSVKVIIALVIVAVLLTICVAFLLTRSIAQPINTSLLLAEKIAEGDLTHSILVAGKDEAADLMRALSRMQQNLRETIHNIANSSSQLSSAAVEMTSITDTSNRTLQQQSSEIEQAATAVNEMSAAVEEVARNASSTSESARQSSATATSGNQKVNETLIAMQQLTQQVNMASEQVGGLAVQAQNISQVVAVIRGVAEQTNLLALNAAIEAARAGEQGRGFAVVADEVRALAHRTQTSTKEIEEIIAAIQSGTSDAVNSIQISADQANETYEKASQAGEALQVILAEVVAIEERNLQIAAASEEQAYVAREVDKNLVSIRNLSIQSGEGADQTLVASNDLSKLAVNLENMVRRFKV